MNRGEIWTAAGGVYSSRPRPVLLLQDDLLHDTESVVVIPLTTVAVDAPLTRIAIPADPLSGIGRDSHAMVDKITTVRRNSLGQRLGRATSVQMVEVERALMVVVGVAR